MIFIPLLALLVAFFILFYKSKEGYYSDYQTMSQLPFITPPMGHGMLGTREQHILREKYPDAPLPRFGNYNPISEMRVYETGTAYDPNVYSSFGTVTPDDIFMF